MINEFKFLAWTVNSKILSKEKFFLRTNSLSKSCSIIEKEINSSGGIFNKPVKIIFKNFSEAPKGYDELINYVNSNKDIIAMTGSGTLKDDEFILEQIDLDNILFFTFVENHKIKHKNLFITTQTAYEPKVKFAEYFIKEHTSSKKIIFLHEGKRLKNDFIKLLNAQKSNFVDYDLSLLNADNSIDNQVHSIIQNIIDNDILILDIKPTLLLSVLNYLNNNKKNPLF